MRVLTTKQLSEFYEVQLLNIKKNFSQNKDKYIEGKHYILLNGEELSDFKQMVNTIEDDKVTNGYLVNSNPQTINTTKGEITVCTPVDVPARTRHLYLWTERGALLHAKSINTDKAWDVYEQLIDTYFRVQEYEAELPASRAVLPRVPDWHRTNYDRISKLCSILGLERKQMYHLILRRCSESYDMNEAKALYKKERGFSPQYAIDVVGYFPELSEVADRYLSELELLYKREV